MGPKMDPVHPVGGEKSSFSELLVGLVVRRTTNFCPNYMMSRFFAPSYVLAASPHKPTNKRGKWVRGEPKKSAFWKKKR